MKRSLSLLMTLVMVVSLLVAPAEATPSDEVVLSGPITTETTSAAVTVTGCEEYIGGRLILTTGPASQTDTDSRRQIANIKLTGTGAITVEFNPGAVLTQGETVLVHLYKYDSAADRFMNKLGNHVEITAPGAVPEVKPGTTPEEILANCSVTILKDGQKRTEPFLVNETSATVRVQLDPGVEQCYLTLFAYASNTAFDPDASHNMRLGSQFVKNGDEVTIKIAEGALKVGYSVIACLNVPVGPDWYKPVNSQAVKIVDESGQGFEDYDPYPNAFINDATLEAGATSMHISLEADARLFQAAKEGKTSLNVAVRQYPDGSDFDFEAEDQVTVYNAHLVTDPIVNQKITLTEPLKAGYRVRAVVYWEQNVSLHLPKGNDYEAMFHRPDDSVLISGEAVKPEPEAPTAAITGPVTPSSKNIVVTTTGEIPAGSRVLVKAYGDNDAILLAQGTLVGAADAAASVTLTPAADSLKTGSKLVAFVLNQGKLLAQSAPVFVGKDAPAGQGTITLNETITVDTKSATVTVAGYDEFKGGRLIVTIGNSVYDDRQLANVAFTGEGTYTVNFSPAYTLREGDQILPFLYLSGDPTRYQPGTVSVVGSSAPDRKSVV